MSATSDLLLNDCALFASSVLRAPPKSEPFQIANHHIEWAKAIRQHRQTLFEASRSSGKTVFVAFAYPIWRAAARPGERTAIFCASDKRARKRIREIRREVETNPKLSFLLPSKDQRGESWSTELLRFRNGSEVEGVGFGSRARGEHPHAIVLDDVINDDSLYSALVREKSIEYAQSAIEPMLEPGGEFRIINTPIHEEDLVAHYRANKTFAAYSFPAEWEDATGQKQYLWPARLTPEYLAGKLTSLGSLRYAREYLCRPVSDAASMFPSKYFDGAFADYELGLPGPWWRENRGIETIVIANDFAISKSIKADYSVIFVFGIDRQGNHWIIDIQRHRGMDFRDQISLIGAAYKKYGADMVACEDVAFSKIFGEELRLESDMPIEQVHMGTSKHSLEEGIPSLCVMFENRKIRCPPLSEPLVKVWMSELQGFTFAKGRVMSTTKHDDCAMAWYVGERCVKTRIDFSFGTGEEENQKDTGESGGNEEWDKLQEDLQGLADDERAEWFGDDAPSADAHVKEAPLEQLVEKAQQLNLRGFVGLA